MIRLLAILGLALIVTCPVAAQDVFGPGPLQPFEPDPVPLPKPIYPPYTVNDLAGSQPTDTGVTLTWTAPDDTTDGGNGDHIAELYDFRYSLTLIDQNDPGTFDSATPLTGEPAPSYAGTPETFVVTGLQPNTWYYFAMKSQDEQGYWSGVSNVVYMQTGSFVPPNPGTGPEPGSGTAGDSGSGGGGGCGGSAAGAPLPVAALLLGAAALRRP